MANGLAPGAAYSGFPETLLQKVLLLMVTGKV